MKVACNLEFSALQFQVKSLDIVDGKLHLALCAELTPAQIAASFLPVNGGDAPALSLPDNPPALPDAADLPPTSAPEKPVANQDQTASLDKPITSPTTSPTAGQPAADSPSRYGEPQFADDWATSLNNARAAGMVAPSSGDSSAAIGEKTETPASTTAADAPLPAVDDESAIASDRQISAPENDGKNAPAPSENQATENSPLTDNADDILRAPELEINDNQSAAAATVNPPATAEPESPAPAIAVNASSPAVLENPELESPAASPELAEAPVEKTESAELSYNLNTVAPSAADESTTLIQPSPGTFDEIAETPEITAPPAAPLADEKTETPTENNNDRDAQQSIMESVSNLPSVDKSRTEPQLSPVSPTLTPASPPINPPPRAPVIDSSPSANRPTNARPLRVKYVCPRCQTPGVQDADKIKNIITCKNCGRAMRLTIKQ